MVEIGKSRSVLVIWGQTWQITVLYGHFGSKLVNNGPYNYTEYVAQLCEKFSWLSVATVSIIFFMGFHLWIRRISLYIQWLIEVPFKNFPKKKLSKTQGLGPKRCRSKKKFSRKLCLQTEPFFYIFHDFSRKRSCWVETAVVVDLVFITIKYGLLTCRACKNEIDLAIGWVRTIWLDLVGQWNSRFREPLTEMESFLYEFIFSICEINLLRNLH